jgi:hypothetical protein
MKIYAEAPAVYLGDWVASIEQHPAGQQVPFHYHDVEEWLQVQQGEMSFVSAKGHVYRVGVGRALKIPRGEVHRVEIGPGGVEYQMWLPVGMPDAQFTNRLNDAELDLIRDNLMVPDFEDKGKKEFFDEFLSDRLTFRAADGTLFNKAEFLNRNFVNRNREASDAVRVLHNRPKSLLLSTVVTVPGHDGSRQSFRNDRLFAQEGERFKCWVWLNYPEPTPPSPAA